MSTVEEPEKFKNSQKPHFTGIGGKKGNVVG